MNENKFSKRREPFAFMLYLAMFGSSILFLAVFLVFLKKEFVNQNIPLIIPKTFWVSSLVIILSSITIYLAKKQLFSQKFVSYKSYLGITYLLGLLFLVLQISGWMELANRGFTMANHTGVSFLYILSGLHILHTFGGIVALSLTVAKVFRNKSYVDSFVYSVNPPNQLNFKLIYIYWHFLDLLWLLIFLFLLYHAT
ncbi:heme-copper oxidase subunit III [Lacihabitans sp. CCS-44]|uniref:cytochrome c oxidase subunit 3 n=1 Tax=Lacihabitans sp. CCS-44 TaxID=2487331 RepID=UPI0020CCC039|nr:cytochrome c oxidase subunit 3 [Lacihabitans sp. CCS-44]MCP9755746.1 heme-copper oxidase subunit III [Lacihabitans sp. CCS-44]